MRTGELVVVAALMVAACSPLPLPAAENGGPFSTDFTQLLANFTDQDKNTTETTEAEALKFLQNFGYLEKSRGEVENFYSGEAVVNAIKEMQKYGAIPQTGKLDNETVTLFHKPRCGVSDVTRSDDPQATARLSLKRRTKRWVKGSEGWRKRTITYFISNWSPKLSEAVVASEMQKAFQVWAQYGNLKFIRVNNPDADIIVAFGRGPHGDGFPFDGNGQVLAHAFYPYEYSSFGGDIHFDDDEKWKLKLDGPFDDGIDFFSVAVHELGHSLGLAHSPERDSVMFPYFKGFNDNPARLAYDDVLAMYEMYVNKNLPQDDKPTTIASRSSYQPTRPTAPPTPRPTFAPITTPRAPYRPQPPRPTPQPRPTQRPHQNNPYHPDKRVFNGTGTATTTTTEKSNFVPTYEGDYDTVTAHRKKFGHSTPAFGAGGRLTTEMAESASSSTTLVSSVTEVTATKDQLCEGLTIDKIALVRGELIVIKGSQLWRLSDRGITVPGYPVPFKRLFWQLPEEVTQIDAIYERPTDNEILIFSGDKFWETDGSTRVRKLPRPLTALGLPPSVKKIDAIMVWGKNGQTYIFSENHYWKYNENAKQMEAGYPLKITERWRGIPNNIDSVMTFKDGLTYFFKGKQFWRFDNSLIQTERQYPKLSAKEWLGCA